MTGHMKWTVATATLLASVVWIDDYHKEFAGGQPQITWWLAALRTWSNSAGGSALDYFASIIVWLWVLTGAFETSLSDLAFSTLEWLKTSIEEQMPVDTWWQDRWHNKLANWLGRFTFSLIISYIVVDIAKTNWQPFWRFAMIFLILLPMLGVAVGRSFA